MTTVVLYHGPGCTDGFAAAWAAYRALGKQAIYIPAQYGKPYPPEIEGGVERLFLLDISYPRKTLERLAQCAGEIVVLDHHRTAQAELAGLPYAHFDMDKSGAVMAWEYFHPGRRHIPALLKYVQDRDLWRWELPESREVSAAIQSYPMTFEVWDDLAYRPIVVLANEGASILRYQEQLVNRLCGNAAMREIAGYRVPVVNTAVLQSEVGNELCRRFPDSAFAAVYFDTDGRRRWSLRSVGEFDVSEIARRFGGGGHRNAAGFEDSGFIEVVSSTTPA